MARSRFVLGLCVLAMAVSNLAHAQSLSHDPRSHGAPATPIILAPPCGPTSITESTDPASVASNNAISCNTGSPGFFHTDNSYYRRFDLPSLGVDGDFEVCNVEIGVEVANDGGAAGQPLTVNLHVADLSGEHGTLVGTAVRHGRGPGAERAVDPGDGNPSCRIRPGRRSLHAQRSRRQQRILHRHQHRGESAPSYIKAASCGITVPGPSPPGRCPNRDIVMSVTGRPLTIAPGGPRRRFRGNGVLEMGESVAVVPSARNETLTSKTVGGTAANLGGPGARPTPSGTPWPATARSRAAPRQTATRTRTAMRSRSRENARPDTSTSRQRVPPDSRALADGASEQDLDAPPRGELRRRADVLPVLLVHRNDLSLRSHGGLRRTGLLPHQLGHARADRRSSSSRRRTGSDFVPRGMHRARFSRTCRAPAASSMP